MDVVTALIIISLVTIAAHVGVAWYFHSGRNSEVIEREILKERLSNMDNKLEKSSKEMRDVVKDQFKDSRVLIKDITKQITEVKKTNEKVFDITESLKNLEKVLKNQKERGSLGESGLHLMLENFLEPGTFQMQYSFDNGDAVDAVIKAKDGIIPIDAKFPLSNYNRLLQEEDEDKKEKVVRQFKRDIKERINETAKYIRPDENTLPFALMYVPAEGVYYDLLVNKVGTTQASTRNLIEYAHEKNVVVVSPTTLAAYLHTILQGMRAFRIEKNAEQIQDGVEKLRKHLRSYEEAHQRLGKNLSTAVNYYDKTNVKLRGIGRDVRQITNAEFKLDGEEVENPRLDKEN